MVVCITVTSSNPYCIGNLIEVDEEMIVPLDNCVVLILIVLET